MNYPRFVFWIVLGWLFILISSELTANDSTFLAGAAKVDISPTTLPARRNGGFLEGFSDRVQEPLYARSLVLSDGKESIAIVIVDSCMFPVDLCDRIKQLASKATGIPNDRILISATHTHSAPSAMLALGCPADEPYVKFVPPRVAQSIADAQKNLQPAKLGWAVVDGTELTNCRRWITRSDRMGTDPFGQRTVRAMMHPGYQNPNYTSPAGPIDPWLTVLSVVSAKDDSPICLMANLSMHYFGGGAFSPDYFGEVAQMLEERIAKKSVLPVPGFVGIMSQGTSGDLHWMDYSQPRRGINRQQYSKAVTDRILQAFKEIKHQPDLSIDMSEKRLTIDRRIPSKGRREWARPINAARQGRSARSRVEVYAEQAEWIHNHPEATVVLQAVRIGDVGITALPNEVYGITGLKLKRQSPLNSTFNLELANGASGYIPPPEQHRLGGYTTWPARTAGLVETAEPLIVETLLDLMEKVSGKERKPITVSRSRYSQAVIKKKPVAYWRMDDMNSTKVADATGHQHASFKGGVALFLPGPESTGFDSPKAGNESQYANRSVYLAGGFVEANLTSLNIKQKTTSTDYSVILWFSNMLPSDARGDTGVLLSTAHGTLSIAGNKRGPAAGRLVFSNGKKSQLGKAHVSTNHWQMVTLIKQNQKVSVYLNGNPTPELVTKVETREPLDTLRIGSDGKTDATFDGKVDEVALFDFALVESDIVDLYRTSGMAPPPQPKPSIVLGPKPSDEDSRARYAKTILNSKPIAFWRLHDKSRESAKDQAGNFDADYEAGAAPHSPNAIKKNFTGGRVKARLPKLGNTYSVELWFRNELPVDARPVTAYVFSRAVDKVEGAMGDNLGIGGTHSHSGRLIVFNGNEKNQLAAGRTRIPTGSWSHVVLVRKEQNIKVYLNGDPEPEISATLPVGYPQNCGDILLGGRADNFANLQGMLEDVAIYDRQLTPKEVEFHFKASGAKQIDQIEKPDSTPPQKPTPIEADKALSTIQIRSGFKVQLVAAEPLVKDPVAIDWGADGKLWVVEMADYPLGIDGKGQAGGRVRFLEDTNQDGRYDKSTLFAEGLSFPTGVLAWGKGILVTAAPQILYMEDSTGDGKADIRRVLYSGFLEGNQQLRVNGLRWGLDNWVYCASGSHHAGYGKDSQITSLVTGRKHRIGSRDFRIQPNTGDIDPQSGPSQYGRVRDDWGDWFGVQNSHPLWHYVLADHHIRRNPHFAPPDPRHQVVTPTNPRVFPASQLQKRFHSFSQSGRFTSACSPMIYRDEILFARGKEQHAFTCEPFHNLVQHNLISDEGVSFRFRRDPAESKIDFFASTDRWCRPVMARTGPDGAIWIVDMYRYMIEHPQWLPQNGKDELRPWYRSGEDRGRIYKVVSTDRKLHKVPLLADASRKQLVATLKSTNGWQRDMAQRLLVNGNHRDAIPSLKIQFTESTQPLTRIHALCTLDGLNALSANLLEAAFRDEHPRVRRIAVRIASRIQVRPEKLAGLLKDPDFKVRLELAGTLGSYHSIDACRILAALILEGENDRFLLAAAMSSLNQKNVASVFDAAITNSRNRMGSSLFELIGQVVALGNQESLAKVISLICTPSSRVNSIAKFESLAKIMDGIEAKKINISDFSTTTKHQIANTIQQARKAVENQNESVECRIAATGLLGRESQHRVNDFQVLGRLLVPQSPLSIQRAIIESLSKRREIEVAQILLAGWRSHAPTLRNQILLVLSSRSEWSETLRQKLESGDIAIGELNASIRQTLMDRNKNKPIWHKLLANLKSIKRTDVVNKFSPALKLKGNSQRGEKIFRKLCISCHKWKKEGHEVGPQLASVTNKSKEALLVAILDPNAAVDAKYMNYLVGTVDGRSYSGRLEAETGSSITLLAADSKRSTVLRRDIENLKTLTQSVMPEGLEQGLSFQDMADLIRFVQDNFQSSLAK